MEKVINKLESTKGCKTATNICKQELLHDAMRKEVEQRGVYINPDIKPRKIIINPNKYKTKGMIEHSLHLHHCNLVYNQIISVAWVAFAMVLILLGVAA